MPPRFPLLIKIIDARETLSLQVHPPADKAVQLGGEPKTEMWYVAQAGPGAELFVGLKLGVSRQPTLKASSPRQIVAECFFHRTSTSSPATPCSCTSGRSPRCLGRRGSR